MNILRQTARPRVGNAARRSDPFRWPVAPNLSSFKYYTLRVLPVRALPQQALPGRQSPPAHALCVCVKFTCPGSCSIFSVDSIFFSKFLPWIHTNSGPHCRRFRRSLFPKDSVSPNAKRHPATDSRAENILPPSSHLSTPCRQSSTVSSASAPTVSLLIPEDALPPRALLRRKSTSPPQMPARALTIMERGEPAK